MPTKLDLANKRFGSLVVIGENGRDSWGAVLWRCTCDCGRNTIARGSHLIRGATRSCGCGVQISRKAPKKHGQSHSALFRRWMGMRNRCQNPNGSEYHNYGGRGIRICERWQNFSNFDTDMGQTFREDLEIERKDNDGNYEPANCIWISHRDQQRNKRTNHLVCIGGVSKTMVEWGEETGIKPNTILTRIRRGWDESRLLREVT